MNFTDRIDPLLVFLYGDSTAAQVGPRLQEMIGAFRSRLPGGSSPRQTLSEKDAVLITYADNFRRAGETPLQTLNGFLNRQLEGAFSTVHLLPFYPYSSDDGFSVIDYYQVDQASGSWEDIAALRHDYRLMFDAVLNHVSKESQWFKGFLRGDERYSDYFIKPSPDWDLTKVARPRVSPLLTPFDTPAGPQQVWTTFSADQIDLNYANPDLLLEVVSVIFFYIEHGASILRLDAVAYLWKETGTTCLHLPQTHALIKLLRAVLDQAAPHVLLISETNVPHDENVSYFGQVLGENGQTDEAQLVYQFPLAPLILHTFASGSSSRLNEWARHLSSAGIFFNFTASHDGIGLQPAKGLLSEAEIDSLVERVLQHGGHVSMKAGESGQQSPYELNITWFDALNSPADPQPDLDCRRFLASQAVMLSLAGVPGVYVHSLFGSHSCQACFEETGRARSLNREKFELPAFEDELVQAGSRAGEIFAIYRHLLQVRAGQPAFHPLGAQQVLDLGPAVFALLRVSPDGHSPLFSVTNVRAERTQVQINPSRLGLSAAAGWKDTISGKIYPAVCSRIDLSIEPYQTLWLIPTSQNRK